MRRQKAGNVVVNYRIVSWLRLGLFVIFLAIFLIAVPVYVTARFDVGTGDVAGKVVAAPLMGAFYLFLVWRTARFNIRIRNEPRALQWDERSLSLWREGKASAFCWSQVADISVQNGKRASDQPSLKVTTLDEAYQPKVWCFSADRLSLGDLTMSRLAKLMLQARKGEVAHCVDDVSDAEDIAAERRERLAHKSQSVGRFAALTLCLLLASLVGMFLYQASRPTTLLTPSDPRLWQAAKFGFFLPPAAYFLWCVKITFKLGRLPSPAMIPYLFFMTLFCFPLGVPTGIWAYNAAEIYIAYSTFSGDRVKKHVEQLPIDKAFIHNTDRKVTVELPNNGKQRLTLTVDPLDYGVFAGQEYPNSAGKIWCLAVQVEEAGAARRVDGADGIALNTGSVRHCS